MSTIPPKEFSMITINGKEYMPTPHEVHPELPENLVWTGFRPNSLFLSDPKWWDALGQDLIKQRRIWAVPSESGQVDQFRQLLHDRPDRALHMMFAAAAEGSPHVVRFLLEQGIKASANEADGDDMTLVPLQAAAYQGHLDCVKILVEEGKLDPNTLDDLGGTPLMRACWGNHADIVEYLLAVGADISIRQTATPPSSKEPGTNALGFAGGSGCLEGAKLIVKHAEGLGLPTTDLTSPLALAAAAHSDDLETLRFFLSIGGYHHVKRDNLLENGIGPLTDPGKDAIEGAFQQTLQRSRYKNLKELFAFIDSRTENAEYQWTSLKDETVDALIEALWQLAAYDDKEHREVFVFVSDIVLAQNSRFTNLATQERKEMVLNDAFFRAAQKDCLDMMKLIESKHEKLNVNHLAHYLGVEHTTPLYIAASSGLNNIVEHLFNAHGERLNVHLGSGKFVNGPTALWIAVGNGRRDTAKLLLERGGGPLEYIDTTAKPGEERSKVIVTATKGFRSPVRLVSETAWIKEHGGLREAVLEGRVTDKAGMEVKYVVLELESGDSAWWNTLQLRKSDEELLPMEMNGRPLKLKELGI